jgi:predicted Zn-dependent peptidase
MRKFVYQLYNDDRCAVVISPDLHSSRVYAAIEEANSGWLKAAVVQIAETSPNQTSRVLSLEK